MGALVLNFVQKFSDKTLDICKMRSHFGNLHLVHVIVITLNHAF